MQEEEQDAQTEELNGGKSLSALGALIKRRIIWILLASVAAALIAGLLAHYVVSPSRVNYRLAFTVDYPDRFAVQEDGTLIDKMRYPDGEPFRPERIVSAARLAAAKESDAAFGNVDTEAMSAAGDIYVTSAAEEENKQAVRRYSITVSGKYFDNASQAANFLKAVCDEAYRAIVAKAEETDFDADLISYESVATFESKIAILEKQHRSVVSRYENYLSLYGSFSHEGKTIAACHAEATALFESGEVNLELLKADLEYHAYPHKQSEDAVIIEISLLQREKELNDLAIKALKETVQGFSSGSLMTDLNAYHSKISEYTDRNVQIDGEVEKLYRSIGYEKKEDGEYEKTGTVVDSAAFEAKLEKLHAEVLKEAQTCQAMIGALYAQNTGVYIEQGGVSELGGANAVIYAAAAFVLAFCVATAAFFVADKLSKRKDVPEKTEDTRS